MPSKDANGNLVYSQAEYEHFNFTGEPFSGFVEGMGYYCSETIVIGYPHNASGSHVMFDINIIEYNFSIHNSNDLQSNRNEYTTIPNIPKFSYRDNWYNPTNVAAFVDNVVIDLVNPIIDIVNGAMVSSQVGLNEGFDAWWEYEKASFQNMINAPVDYAKGMYNYATNTPASQQFSDLKRDISNPHTWEGAVAMGLGLYTGGRVIGGLPKTNINISYLNPQRLLKREYFKLHPRITNPRYNYKLLYDSKTQKMEFGFINTDQMDIAHRAASFVSTDVMQTGNIGIKNYKTIYFNKTYGNKTISVAINPWTRTIYHEGPGLFK